MVVTWPDAETVENVWFIDGAQVNRMPNIRSVINK